MSDPDRTLNVKRRVFLALWPNPDIRRELFTVAREVAESGGGRVTPHDNLHITLVFLGSVGDPQLAAIHECAGEVVPRAFTLCLDRLQYRSRSQIAWLAAGTVPAALSELVDALGDRLRRRGFVIESRVFRPHVTLVRKARRRPRRHSPAIEWRVTEFVLVESLLGRSGARYRPLERWTAT